MPGLVNAKLDAESLADARFESTSGGMYRPDKCYPHMQFADDRRVRGLSLRGQLGY